MLNQHTTKSDILFLFIMTGVMCSILGAGLDINRHKLNKIIDTKCGIVSHPLDKG